MALPIDEAKKALGALVMGVNAEEQLRMVDWVRVGEQMLDADEDELTQLVDVLKGMDLKDDALEAKIKMYADIGAKPIAYALRILKIFLPK